MLTLASSASHIAQLEPPLHTVHHAHTIIKAEQELVGGRRAQVIYAAQV